VIGLVLGDCRRQGAGGLGWRCERRRAGVGGRHGLVQPAAERSDHRVRIGGLSPGNSGCKLRRLCQEGAPDGRVLPGHGQTAQYRREPQPAGPVLPVELNEKCGGIVERDRIHDGLRGLSPEHRPQPLAGCCPNRPLRRAGGGLKCGRKGVDGRQHVGCRGAR
jgi:hypothetical protein